MHCSCHGVASRCVPGSCAPSCHPGSLRPGVLTLDALSLSPDFGVGLGKCALSRAAPDGLLGLRGSRQKLSVLGLAELGDGRPMESGFGIFSLPSAAAGSLIFSPNDSRTVRRVDPVDSSDRGEYGGGGCRCALLSRDPRCIHPRASGGTRLSPSSSAGFGVLPIAGGPDSSSDMGLTIEVGANELALV